MKVLLIRHGEIEEPAPGLASIGHDDPSLTNRGRRQAAALAMELMAASERGEPFQALYTSPLRAARTTAEALSAVLDIGEARLASAVTTLTPEVLPAGEMSSLAALQTLAWDFLLELKQEFDQLSSVIVVTHELTIRALVCRALDMSLDNALQFDLDPASMTTIEFRLQRDRERTLIAALNDTCHDELVVRA